MTARIIDGKAHAAELRARVAKEAALARTHGLVPGLAVVLVGDDPASRVYVAAKARAAAEAGIRAFDHRLPSDVAEAALLALVERLNLDERVHGILVQLPLPRHIRSEAILRAIDPEKDVDGFHPVNAGLLATGQCSQALVSCTPLGCFLLLEAALGGALAGKEAVVLGRSNIVGRPMAQLLLSADCTVTIVHSKTRDLASHCRRADILIAALGKPRFVTADMVKEGAVVIDVGITRLPPDRPGARGRLVGDVAFEEVAEKAAAITPVPGGVGPMTIACLLSNTVTAATWRKGLGLRA
jgi:methylenetetrahydrofolate dehydrogenase (NADP+)/methenyltetrahydrofolate cyclohydrolase